MTVVDLDMYFASILGNAQFSLDGTHHRPFIRPIYGVPILCSYLERDRPLGFDLAGE
jgi:hypothetical protein